jgi:hypothetical protein
MNSSPKHAQAAIFFVAVFAVIGAVLYLLDCVGRLVILQLHPDGTTFAASFSWIIVQWSYMFPALFAGLYVCIFCIRCRPRSYLIAMTGIQGLVIVRALLFSLPNSAPAELWLLNLFVVPFIFCSGPLPFIRRRWDEIASDRVPCSET